MRKRMKTRSSSSAVATAADKMYQMEDEAVQGDWRTKCIEEFGLLPFPEGWATDALTTLSQADDATWERYYKFRSACNEDNEKRMATEEEDAEEDEDCGLAARLREAFVNEVKKVGGEGAALWLKHAHVVLYRASWEDRDELCGATFKGFVFSPYALPRAMKLTHRCHSRARSSWCEFFVTWHFKLCRFDGQPGGDRRQAELEKQFPEGYILNDLPNGTVTFDSDNGEMLCSNELDDPPTVSEEIDEGIYHRISKTDVSGLTQSTVHRIRAWIFGNVIQSEAVLDDFSLMRLVFATCGSARFGSIESHIGYSWPQYGERDQALADMQECGFELTEEERENFSVNWLEHQVRTICGALRPIDKFYIPEDTVAEWAKWGAHVCEELGEDSGLDRQDEDLTKQLEDYGKFPFLVYLDAKKGKLPVGGRGNNAAAMAMMLALLGRH